jgi:hypothetical protein
MVCVPTYLLFGQIFANFLELGFCDVAIAVTVHGSAKAKLKPNYFANLTIRIFAAAVEIIGKVEMQYLKANSIKNPELKK